MSLSKQFILLVSTIFILIFSVNFVISINNIKNYLQEESQIHAQDTATSLGLSLSPYIADLQDPTIETMINTIFDRGYFLQIKLDDPDGNTVIDRKNPPSFELVPDWFRNALVLETSTGVSDISAGWVPGGTIYVRTNPGYGYLKLYLQAKNALYYSLFTFAISMALVIFALRFIVSPLKRIETLANQIAQGKFETIEKLPYTVEIKNVAIAMNSMSKKIEGVITKLNKSLEDMNKKLAVDELTGLNVRQTFETDMKKLFIAQGSGYIFSIKIQNLGEVAKHQGNDAADNLLKDFAIIMKESANRIGKESISLYRFFGSEFAMIAKGLDYDTSEKLAKEISDNLKDLSEKYDQDDIAHIGGTPFNPIGTTPGIMAGAKEAYEKAKQIGINAYALRDSTDLAKDMQEWKDLVFDIIQNGLFEVGYIGQSHTFADNTLFIEEAFTRAKDREGQPIPIGTFVSIAEKFDKIIDFDHAVVKKVISHAKQKRIGHDITINLSLKSVQDQNFRSTLSTLLAQNQNIANRIVFSLTAYNAAKDIDSFKALIELAHAGNAKIVLKRFEAQFIPLDNIKDFNLDYIRLARDYTTGIAKDQKKRAFVEAMRELGDLLDVKIYAESVKDDNDFETIRKIALYGASR